MYKLIEISNLHNLRGFDLNNFKLKFSNELISTFEGDGSQFEIYDEQTALRETLSIINLNNTEPYDFFIGEFKEGFSPGKIDLSFTLFIGQTAYSEPFALYFKKNLTDPEVIHFVTKDNTDVWIRVFSSYREMLRYI